MAGRRNPWITVLVAGVISAGDASRAEPEVKLVLAGEGKPVATLGYVSNEIASTGVGR